MGLNYFFSAYRDRLFKTLSQIRTKNGLIFNDFERYNNYLSRRIYAIRRKLKFHGGMKSKSYSYRTPSKQQQQLTDIRILHLPLLMSERCLARSHILRSSDQDSVNKFRAAHHSISRLAKSVVFSQRLVNVCDIANCPPMSKLEARAYLDYNIAHCKFEKRKFDEAFRHYKESKQALKSLRTHSIDNEDTKKFLSDQIATIDERLYECMYLLGGTVDNQDSDHEMLCEGDLQSHENDESVNYFEPYKKDVYRPILLQNMLDSLETITDDSTHSEFEKLLKRSDLLIHVIHIFSII
ncbi:MAG: signal recognition particle subunit srp68 [Marteilia pararefringens]